MSNNQITIDEIKKRITSRQMETLHDIFYVCCGIKSNRVHYTTEKAHTVIGAAIFYGPKNRYIQHRGRSKKSVETGEVVMDHVYSRKASGKYFMEHDMNFQEFLNWYWNKASIWVEVTRQENMKLKEIQQEVDAYNRAWQDTYERAEITLENPHDIVAIRTPEIALLPS